MGPAAHITSSGRADRLGVSKGFQQSRFRGLSIQEGSQTFVWGKQSVRLSAVTLFYRAVARTHCLFRIFFYASEKESRY